MITCRFWGRLGNVLLSSYTCFWYADKVGVPRSEVVFPKSYFRRLHGLDAVYGEDAVEYLEQNKAILSAIWDHLLPEPAYWNAFKVNKPERLTNTDSDLLNVFFTYLVWHLPQSEKDVELFRELFLFDRDGVKQANGQYFSNDLSNIAFHVRRTDYAIHKKGMYLESLERVQERLNPLTGCNIVCFSDDPEWCQGNLVAPKDSRWTIKPANLDEPACNDMMLMACFDDINSTSHSTYSYCAKLLNRNVKEIPMLDFQKG